MRKKSVGADGLPTSLQPQYLSVSLRTPAVRVRPRQAGGPEGRLRSECSGAQETVLLCFSWEQNPLVFLQKQASKPTSFSFLIQGEFFQTRPQKGLPHVPLVPYSQPDPCPQATATPGSFGQKPSCRPSLSKLRGFIKFSSPGSPSEGNMESPQANADESVAWELRVTGLRGGSEGGQLQSQGSSWTSAGGNANLPHTHQHGFSAHPTAALWESGLAQNGKECGKNSPSVKQSFVVRSRWRVRENLQAPFFMFFSTNRHQACAMCKVSLYSAEGGAGGRAKRQP